MMDEMYLPKTPKILGYNYWGTATKANQVSIQQEIIMSRIEPAKKSELSEELQVIMDQSMAMMGFIPNDALIMAKHPKLLHAFSQLINTIYSFDSISEETRATCGRRPNQSPVNDESATCRRRAANCTDLGNNRMP